MFNGLREEIKKLNGDVKTVANCEKAKTLRKKLLSIGIPIAVLGFLGVFVCFILFATAGSDGFKSGGGFSARLLIPFILFIPFGIVGCIGATIAGMGFKILVTGYATKLVDETVGNNCPACGDPIDGDETFCSACGARVKKECPSCHTVNPAKDKFCKKCGTPLE